MARVGYCTDTGRLRGNNEDELLVLQKKRVYAVADGVGGHNSGEVASKKAVTGLEAYINEHPIGANYFSTDNPDAYKDYFRECLNKINRDIIDYTNLKPENSGMATTLAAVIVYLDKLYVVNIGDSRVYKVRDGTIRQITKDHTVVNQMIENGDLTMEEARVHPRKNEITKALGVEEEILPDYFDRDLLPGDRILLCTDGLYGELSDYDICDTVSLEDDLNDICELLIDKANANGGRDNITVICVEI